MYTTFLVERLFALHEMGSLNDIPKDVTNCILGVLHCLSEETISKVPLLIPEDVIKFIHFQRGKVHTLEIVVKEKDARKAIHEYCGRLHLYANTKWASTGATLHKCPYCGIYTDDAYYDEYDGSFNSAYCQTCMDNEGDKLQFDEYNRGPYKYRTKRKYESTGEMLIRRCGNISYKQIDGQPVGYRKKWKHCERLYK